MPTGTSVFALNVHAALDRPPMCESYFRADPAL